MVVTFSTNLAAADDIVSALDKVLADYRGALDPPEHIVLLSAVKCAMKNAADEARPRAEIGEPIDVLDVHKLDDRGNLIQIGDTVCLTQRDSDRGAYNWMWKGIVVGFGRTRVHVQFPSRSDVSAVGGECLRVCS